MFRQTVYHNFRLVSTTFIVRNIYCAFLPLDGCSTIGPRPGLSAGESVAFAPFIYDKTAWFVLATEEIPIMMDSRQVYQIHRESIHTIFLLSS